MQAGDKRTALKNARQSQAKKARVTAPQAKSKPKTADSSRKKGDATAPPASASPFFSVSPAAAPSSVQLAMDDLVSHFAFNPIAPLSPPYAVNFVGGSRGQLAPLGGDSIDARVQAHFYRTAELLLNHCVLMVNTRPHRIVEIEFYLKDDAHPDPFTHCSDEQLTALNWYFHKQNNQSYKAGTYKGLDITFGHSGAHGGILLRSIQPLEPAGSAVVEGCCLVVEQILRLCNQNEAASIAEFVGGPKYNPVATAPSGLQLVLQDPPSRLPVYSSPRVGLTLKQATDLDNRLKYLMKPYRFFTSPRLSKGRPNLVLAILKSLRSSGAADAVAATTTLTGTKKNTVDSYEEAFKKGQAKRLQSFAGKKCTPVDWCEMYGAAVSASLD